MYILVYNKIVMDMIDKINNFEDKNQINFKGFIFCLIMVFVYFIVPQLIGAFLYYKLKLNDLVAVVIGNIVLAFIFLIIYFPKLKKQFREYFSNSDNFYDSLKIWGIGFSVMIISNIFLVSLVFPDQISRNEELNRIFLHSYPLLSFFEISLVAPFVEEMIFRFSIRKATGKNKYFPLITGLIFGLLHALTEISSPLELLYTIPYGALGYAFGYLYNKSDNIFSSMSVHIMHNFMTYLLIILFT